MTWAGADVTLTRDSRATTTIAGAVPTSHWRTRRAIVPSNTTCMTVVSNVRGPEGPPKPPALGSAPA
jgi:hypothetical protein